MIFGERIKEERKRQGWTRKELSEKSGTSETAINQYENGLRMANVERAWGIAKALDVSIEHLLGVMMDIHAKAKKTTNMPMIRTMV